MSDSNSYSELLAQLSRAYYNRSLEFADYRRQRRQLLDTIDVEYNGADIDNQAELPAREDDTNRQPRVEFGQTDTQPNFTK